MQLIQKYFLKQALVPLLLSLGALSVLAVLTQSLSTIDLIVENKQSAGTFFFITIMALPRLFGIIIPLAVFMAMLFALNRLNVDRELMVSKASGLSPWQICAPALRIATIAMIAHLIINLFLQPLSMQKMRIALLNVSADLAARMISVGEFTHPTPGLMLYVSEVKAGGGMRNVVIYDERSAEQPLTYMAERGQILHQNNRISFSLFDGSINQIEENGTMTTTKFSSYEFDFTQFLKSEPVLRLKKTDRYLYDLLYPAPHDYINFSRTEGLKAEGHARLAAPLYNILLVLLALAFLARGEFQKLGYTRKIAIAAITGFSLRLVGIWLASESESTPALNIVQYAFPIGLSLLLIWYLARGKRVKLFGSRRKKGQRLQANAVQTSAVQTNAIEAPHA